MDMLSDDASDCLLPNPETEESKREDDAESKFSDGDPVGRWLVSDGKPLQLDSAVPNR